MLLLGLPLIKLMDSDKRHLHCLPRVHYFYMEFVCLCALSFLFFREILLQAPLLLPSVWLCSAKEACSLPSSSHSEGTCSCLLGWNSAQNEFWLATKKKLIVWLIFKTQCLFRSTRACRESDGVLSSKPLNLLTFLFFFFCSPNTFFLQLTLSLLLPSAGEPGSKNRCGDRGCPQKGVGSSRPFGRAPAIRYPTFISRCGGCSLPSGQGRGGSAA